MQKKKRKKIKNRWASKIILAALIIFLVILVVLLWRDFQGESITDNLFKEPKLYKITDECQIIFNNIIHEIKNEGECKILCRNECQIREREFYDINFTEKDNDCHTCNCYCK